MSLWYNLIKFIEKRSPQRRTYIKIPVFCQRTSFCIRQKASYSIEAAIVIPLLAGFLLMLLSFFRILQVQCCIEEALLYAGRSAAVESCVVESEALLFLSLEGFFLEALGEEPLVDTYVENGALGIKLWKSKVDGQMIYINATYNIHVPILFWDIGAIEFTSSNCVRRWNVSHYEVEDTDYVYVTATGEVYHATTSCRVLDLKIRSANVASISTLRGKNGQKYYLCTKCESKEDKKGKVYYTDYGTRYHKTLECSYLKRTIDKIQIEDIGTRRPCSYCY